MWQSKAWSETSSIHNAKKIPASVKQHSEMQIPVQTKTKPKVHPNTQPITLNKDSINPQPKVQVKAQAQVNVLPKVQVQQKVKVVQASVKVQPKSQVQTFSKAQPTEKAQAKVIVKTHQPLVKTQSVAKVQVKAQVPAKIQSKVQVQAKTSVQTIPQAKIQSITPIAVIKPISAIATPAVQTQMQPVDFSVCTKNFKMDSQKLFYLTLSGLNANRFSIDEIKSLTGYVMFSASQKQFLAMVIKIDSKTSMLKIVPCNNIYLFSAGIVQNMFKYVELNVNTPIENLKIL